jgi:hypothetical protein
VLDLVQRALPLLRDGKPARLVQRKAEAKTAAEWALPASAAPSSTLQT